MKKLINLIIIFLFLAPCLQSQTNMTSELRSRLQGKYSFTEIKNEVKAYFREEKLKISPTDSLKQRKINRQLKFWSRWFYENESRLEPDGTIANWTKRMLDAESELNRLEQAEGRAANSSWSLIGPTNVDEEDGIGRVLRLGFHPTNDQYIYAGTARGGLWRSTNGGTSWSSISSFLPSLGVSGIEVSQSDPNDIYILSGEGDAWMIQGYTFNYGYVSYSNGVFKSTDNGATWKKTAEFQPGIDTTRYVGFQLRQDPNNSSAFMAATNVGLFRTANGGSSWTAATFNNLSGGMIDPATNNIGCFDVEFKPGSSTVIYAGCFITNSSNNTRFAFFRSTNSGALFSEVNLSSDINVNNLIRFEIGVTPANSSLVFLLCGPGNVVTGDGSDDSFLGFLKSTNSGASFTNIATEPDVFAYNPTIGPTLGNQCFYDMALAISPTNANLIFTGGLVVFRSTDGGVDFDGNTTYWTWEVGETIHPDIHDLKYNPLNGKLYAASDGGVFVTSNNGGAWSPIFNGMSITQFYHSEPDNENNKLWGGTQDNGILEQESGGTFLEFDAGDGYDVMTDNIVGNGNDSYWTTNCCMVTTHNTGNADITPPDPLVVGRDYGNLDMKPTNEDHIYVGYADAIWYSNDRGDSWEIDDVNNVLDNGAPTGEWCIQTCNSNVARLYAAGSGNMWRIDAIDFEEESTGTSTSLRTALKNAGFPTNSSGTQLRKITDILVNPSTSVALWVTAGGFNAGKKVFYSANSGSTWSNITYNLPNIPANCLLREGDGTLYVGMDAGVFYLPPGENNWMPYYNNLPRVPVTEMHFVTEFIPPSTFTKYLYVSTYGRGIWKSQTFTGCTSTVNLGGTLRGQRFYQASSSITSTSIVDGGPGTNVYFQSGNSITLNIGFEGRGAGSEFTGFVQACNTGPLPFGTEVPEENRDINATGQLPAVIESVIRQNDDVVIRMKVRSAGRYSLQLMSAEGAIIKTLKPTAEYLSGEYTFRLRNPEFENGLQYIALLEENQPLHFQEYQKE